MAKFGHTVMMQKKAERNKEAAAHPPKGFDISLTELVDKYELSNDQIKRLGELSATRRSGLAHATIGHNVYYRERQVVEMLNIPSYTAAVVGD